MNNTATMFLNNVTSIDHAYIDEHGYIVGGSVDPKFLVYGELNGEEAVVVDFSQVKKDLKKIIDDEEDGWDHKLWITEHSKCEVSKHSYNVEIKTPFFTIDMPENGLKCFNTQNMVSEIETKLKNKHPNVSKIEIVFSNDFSSNPFVNTNLFPFRYVHGLKGSTSWGCKNIGHGHTSYIGASSVNLLESNILLAKIAAYYDKKIFLWADNITKTSSYDLDIGYNCSRGHFSMTGISNDNSKVMDVETTVENIAKFIASEWRQELLEAGCSQLYVSEGQNKGSFVDL